MGRFWKKNVYIISERVRFLTYAILQAFSYNLTVQDALAQWKEAHLSHPNANNMATVSALSEMEAPFPQNAGTSSS